MRYLSALIFIGIASCNSPSTKAPSIEGSSAPSLKITFLTSDTASSVLYFPPCFCNLTDSGVVINHINRGGFVGESLITVFNNGSTRFHFRTWSDVGDSPKYIVEKQNLTLNQSSFKIGEKVNGKINLSGYSFEFDSTILKSRKMYFQIDGDFRCELKDTSYTYKVYIADLRREFFRREMEKLEQIAKVKPDSIVELNLNSRDLNSIPEIVMKFSSLKRLNINSNKISVIDTELLNKLSQLEEINFSYNDIREIPEAFSKLHNLKLLDLSANPITHIPNTFYKLDQLTYLDLSATRLTTLSGEVEKLKNLEHLDIGYTKIVTVPQEIFGLDKLMELNLPDSITPFTFANMNLKSLRTLHAPYSFLLFNKSTIQKLKDLEWLYPRFTYETEEEYAKNFPKEIAWLKKALPRVSISEFTSVNSDE